MCVCVCVCGGGTFGTADAVRMREYQCFESGGCLRNDGFLTLFI